MSTQIQPARLHHYTAQDDPDQHFVLLADGTEHREIARFIAYPDERCFVEDKRGGRWFHEGRGRMRLWPYVVAT